MKWLVIVAIAACGGSKDEPATCTCTPGNVAHAKAIGADGPLTGEALLAALRRHRQEVRAKLTPRDIKVHDDELRFQIVDFCQPCADWVTDRLTMEDMFPLDQLDNARTAVCMGLVLRDGKTVYGDARPAACR
jgi:hypothetical protein